MAGAITQGEAVLRIKLDLTQATAERDKFLRGWGMDPLHIPGGGVVTPPAAPGGAGGGGGGGGIPLGGPTPAPGAGGSGFLSGILGAAAGLGIVAASPLGQFGIGLGKRAMGAISDVSEAIGASGFMRSADIPAKTADRTVQMLGIAGAFMSKEQIEAVADTNRMMVELETKAENNIRGSIAQGRIENFLQPLVDILGDIKNNTMATAENTKVSHKIVPGNH